jgi:hypothetical protein
MLSLTGGKLLIVGTFHCFSFSLLFFSAWQFWIWIFLRCEEIRHFRILIPCNYLALIHTQMSRTHTATIEKWKALLIRVKHAGLDFSRPFLLDERKFLSVLKSRHFNAQNKRGERFFLGIFLLSSPQPQSQHSVSAMEQGKMVRHEALEYFLSSLHF